MEHTAFSRDDEGDADPKTLADDTSRPVLWRSYSTELEKLPLASPTTNPLPHLSPITTNGIGSSRDRGGAKAFVRLAGMRWPTMCISKGCPKAATKRDM